jgi:diaminohydroxyphosphoribosylaminopyrimidine deaminase/5-amino-6-(5-phosphoribosylamino)uracil reductase
MDSKFMREALRLARRGFPAPNPHVGCVIVKDGLIVGRGYHDHAGGPHAEVVALQDAGDQARGATAYVTLEPCNHTGRTGPCSLALIEAGVSEVVVAARDPNPKAEGGLERLARHGVRTSSGVLQAEAEEVAGQFFFALRHGRPLVVLKAGASLDGRIALPSGESRWITGPSARREAHRLRAELGAVLVGRRTVEMDDPLLTARIPGVVNQPLRVVLDPGGKLSSRFKVFNGDAPTLHLTSRRIKSNSEGFDLSEVLQAVREAGATGILVEGGAATHAGFIRHELADRIELFLGGVVLGEGPSWVEGHLASTLADARRYRVTKSKILGDDCRVTVEPIESSA